MIEVIETITLICVVVVPFVCVFSFSKFQSASIKEWERYTDLIKKSYEALDSNMPIDSVEEKLFIMSPNELRKSMGMEPIPPPKKEERLYNCPNCGAPITGDKCEYCGTVFRDQSEDAVICYADNRPILTFHNDIKSLQDRISVEEMNANLIRAFYADRV